MYDNDPAKPRNVEIYCFNFPKQTPPPRVAGSDAGQTRCSQDHEQPISRILLLGKLKYLVRVMLDVVLNRWFSDFMKFLFLQKILFLIM